MPAVSPDRVRIGGGVEVAPNEDRIRSIGVRCEAAGVEDAVTSDLAEGKFVVDLKPGVGYECSVVNADSFYAPKKVGSQ